MGQDKDITIQYLEEFIQRLSTAGDRLGEALELYEGDPVIDAYVKQKGWDNNLKVLDEWDTLIGYLQDANLVGPFTDDVDVLEVYDESKDIDHDDRSF